MVVATRFLLLCAVLLVFPAITAGQQPPPPPTSPISIVPAGQDLMPGNATKLIVWVHGCCTDEEDVKRLFTQLSEAYKDQPFFKSGEWQIVVWDWSPYTGKPSGIDNFFAADWIDAADTAYRNAILEGGRLAEAITANPGYIYVHLIGHSAGANVIHEAANGITDILKNTTRPFIYLTFLDAYSPQVVDTNTYGSLPDYATHYAEHYLDVGGLPYRRTDVAAGRPGTNGFLQKAFNFDITDWLSGNDCARVNLVCRHGWPVKWYIQSISPGISPYKYGHRLSLEGGISSSK